VIRVAFECRSLPSPSKIAQCDWVFLLQHFVKANSLFQIKTRISIPYFDVHHEKTLTQNRVAGFLFIVLSVIDLFDVDKFLIFLR